MMMLKRALVNLARKLRTIARIHCTRSSNIVAANEGNSCGYMRETRAKNPYGICGGGLMRAGPGEDSRRVTRGAVPAWNNSLLIRTRAPAARFTVVFVLTSSIPACARCVCDARVQYWIYGTYYQAVYSLCAVCTYLHYAGRICYWNSIRGVVYFNRHRTHITHMPHLINYKCA